MNRDYIHQPTSSGNYLKQELNKPYKGQPPSAREAARWRLPVSQRQVGEEGRLIGLKYVDGGLYTCYLADGKGGDLEDRYKARWTSVTMAEKDLLRCGCIRIAGKVVS